MIPTAFTVDHLAYIRDRRHRRLVHGAFRKISGQKGGVFICEILHEARDECCAIEPWEVTAARINEALEADGLSSLWLVAAKGAA